MAPRLASSRRSASSCRASGRRMGKASGWVVAMACLLRHGWSVPGRLWGRVTFHQETHSHRAGLPLTISSGESTPSVGTSNECSILQGSIEHLRQIPTSLDVGLQPSSTSIHSHPEVLMLQLHRTPHQGHLTTAPSWPSMPSQERSVQGAFSTVFLPLAVPVTPPVVSSNQPPSDAGVVALRRSRFLPTPSGMLARPTWGAQTLSTCYHITNFCPSRRRGASSHASRRWVSAPKIS